MPPRRRPASRKKPSPRRRRFLVWATCAVLIIAAAVTGSLTGLVLTWGFELPQVWELQQTSPDVISEVYSSDGRILGIFAKEKRQVVTYDKIPDTVKNSILAAEDSDFFQHAGIDFRRLIYTVFRNIAYGERKGASTITMQLSKLLLTSPEVTIKRKIQDMIFAIQIERTMSKEQIFTRYVNQLYLGHGRHGLAAASEFYFQKTMDALEWHEAALLVGLFPNPAKYSPINHPEAAVNRRNWVLERAYEEGFIDAGTLRTELQEPLALKTWTRQQASAPYFVEWVRQYLEKRYPGGEIHRRGLKIYTTLDYEFQTAAEKALRDGLKAFDKKRPRWRGAKENILEAGKELEGYWRTDWNTIFSPGQMVHGLVLRSGQRSAEVKVGSYRATVRPGHVEWTGRERLDRVLKAGDVCVFTLESINREERTVEVMLDRIPQVQGALMAIESETGAIRAMVGGFDFRYSKFNRATQAERQPGSVFKPFTYVAAVESGYSPEDTVLDKPVEFLDGLGRPYRPVNADEKFKGLIPIRQALAESRNVPTLRLANAMGVERIVDVAHRFGIQRDIPLYLPTALGAGEVTLEEITSAFSAFPNGGVRVHPYYIDRVEDANGVLLERHETSVDEVVKRGTAEALVDLLRNAVLTGTGRKARSLPIPVAGKTGTTNDCTDSWFVGFSKLLTAGVWVGHDTKVSMGERVYGSTLALPIWIEFMKATVDKTPSGNFGTELYAARRAASVPAPVEEAELDDGDSDDADSGEGDSRESEQPRPKPRPLPNIIEEDIPAPSF
ncbi:MAG: PBP1A family penicillin-binding protein [Acidobacteriota bacterium]|nr:PBP1A family penicillin-binding protein [Acidobacteriota bacterium]